MIYLSDIRSQDFTELTDRQYYEDVNFFDSVFADIAVSTLYGNELRQFGIFTEEAGKGIGTKVKDGITAIGNRILAILQRIQDFISDTIRKFKQNSWKNKDDEQKLREIYRKDPKRYDSVKAAVDAGKLNFASFKDLNDYYDKIDDLMAKVKRGQIDPKSLRGRIQNLGSSLERNKGKIEAIAAVIGIATAASGAYITYKNFRTNTIIKNIEVTQANAEKVRVQWNDVVRTVNKNYAEIVKNGKENENAEVMSILGQLVAGMDRETRMTVNGMMQIHTSLGMRFKNMILHKKDTDTAKRVYDAITKHANNQIEKSEGTLKDIKDTKMLTHIPTTPKVGNRADWNKKKKKKNKQNNSNNQGGNPNPGGNP